MGVDLLRTVLFKILSVILMAMILWGCQSKEDRSAESQNSKELSIERNFIKVNVSKSTDSSNIISYDDEESLKSFQTIFLSAKKEEGIVDMAPPEFHLDIFYDKESKENLYLWIGEKEQKSTLMKAEDTNTIYTVSEKTTEKLMELVKSSSN
ncbi:hypothetical protein CWS01_05325 [Niallia nealsonii]|uniref:YhfM-like domain-containing protein n=1 Tax=Niallia nealsonii TaxID=115979 RepID=A0A2N0Z5B2_9BACI|nr:hypothetical protein CWS01_05325 [Niallia nealsonii]